MDEEQFRAVLGALRAPWLLFRVVSDNSRGTNSTLVNNPLAGYEIPFRGSKDWESQYYDNFTSMGWFSADVMAQAHFRWIYRLPSAFSSWSVSLLDTLIYALMKKYVWNETRILIYVLDTRKVSGPPRIFHARTLIDIFNLTRLPFTKDVWQKARGEYVIYGKLHQHDGFKAVELDALIDAGLLDLGRLFDPRNWKPESREWWFRARIKVRYAYFWPRNIRKPPKQNRPDSMVVDDDGTEFWTLNPTYFPNTRRLAALFGQQWEATMTIAFTSLRRRDLRTEDVQALFQSLDGLPFLPVAPGFREDRFLDQLPECMHFMRMLQMFHDAQGHFPKELSISSSTRKLGWLGGRKVIRASEPLDGADVVDTADSRTKVKQEQLLTPPSSPSSSVVIEDVVEDPNVRADRKRSHLKAELDHRTQKPIKKKRKF